jgi:hypothetical protein
METCWLKMEPLREHGPVVADSDHLDEGLNPDLEQHFKVKS